MFWIGAAVSGATSLIAGGAQAKAQGKIADLQAKQSLQRLAKMQEQQDLQSMQDARNTSATLFNIQIDKQQGQSQIQLQSAATDTIGASVQDALSTVDIITDRQESQAKRDYVVAEEERYRSFMQESTATGQEIQAGYSNAIRTSKSVATSALLGIAGSVAGGALEKAGASYADSALKGKSFTSQLSSAFGSYLK